MSKVEDMLKNPKIQEMLEKKKKEKE